MPNKIKSQIPSDFNINELDEKFNNFIMFLFISRYHITKKNFKTLVTGLFDILSDLGVDNEIQSKYRMFLYSEMEYEYIEEFDNSKYDDFLQVLNECCELRNCTFDLNS
jgi:hypothetical protein